MTQDHEPRETEGKGGRLCRPKADNDFTKTKMISLYRTANNKEVVANYEGLIDMCVGSTGSFFVELHN